MSKHSVATAICAFALSAGFALAQVNTASLTGRVKDASDAVIVDAKITARNTAAHGDHRSAAGSGRID